MKVLMYVLLFPAVVVLAVMLAVFVAMGGAALIGMVFEDLLIVIAFIVGLVTIVRFLVNKFKK